MNEYLFKKPKHIDWVENVTFDNCLLNRKEFGQFLFNYLVGENNGFVLNLNGSWGTGKTEFCKRLYSEFIRNNHPCVYIDAWESDFSKEPLTVVASELLKQMETLHSDIVGLEQTEKIKQILGKTLKSLFVGLAGGMTKKIFDDSSIGIAIVDKLVGDEVKPETFIDQLATDYTEQVDAIKAIRETLADLAEALESELDSQLPVVVIIDELDRCRPNYAIEMLEVIKHFFTTKNLVFVVASDTKQLCESIRNVYGNEFDSNQYLKRFFDRTATLPKPDNYHYITAKYANEKSFNDFEGLGVYPIFDNNMESTILNVISKFSDGFDLKIRDVDQLVNKLMSCLRTAKAYQDSQEIENKINLPVLVCGLIEYERDLVSYLNRNNKTESIPELINKDIEFLDEVKLSTLIEISFYSITEKLEYNYKTNSIRAIDIERYDLPVGDDFNKFIPNPRGASAEMYNLINNLSDVNKLSRNRHHNHIVWRWEDYKKVIELAGYID